MSKRPNMDTWCQKYLTAIMKNMPSLEVDPTLDEVCRVSNGTLRAYVRKRYGDRVPVAEFVAGAKDKGDVCDSALGAGEEGA